jgi:hypothetical protein
MVKRIQREVTLSITQRHDFTAATATTITTAAAAATGGEYTNSATAAATQCIGLITKLK